MKFEQFQKELRKDPEYRKAEKFLKNDLAYQISDKLIALRIRAGLTQAKLGRKVEMKQEAISRLESSKRLPSLSTLKKIAEACGMRVSVNFTKPKE